VSKVVLCNFSEAVMGGAKEVEEGSTKMEELGGEDGVRVGSVGVARRMNKVRALFSYG
jgi:hypothetical protein